MPRQNSFRALCVEAVVFVSLFALVGHLTINFWERYVIQSELTNMKSSLRTLKDTIGYIGNAYDNLHQELKGLANIADQKSKSVLGPKPRAAIESKNTKSVIELKKFKNKYTLDRRILHDLEIQAMVHGKNDVKVEALPKTANAMTEDFKKPRDLGKNASTVTRYPPKSTAAGSDLSKYEGSHYRVGNNIHKCCRELECCDFSCKHWRF